MQASDKNEAKLAALTEAFSQDGFTVTGVQEFKGRLGILAENAGASRPVPGARREPKRAFYVEGTHYEMGYLLGVLAEPQIARMASDFVRQLIPAFFQGGLFEGDEGHPVKKVLEQLISDFLSRKCLEVEHDIPVAYRDEIDGMLAGCIEAAQRERRPPRVKRKNLVALNLGVDCLLAHLYTGKGFKQDKIPPSLLRVPFMCNAFSVSGRLARDGRHYFGRDFMIPTGNVFQDTACMIIYRPEPVAGRRALPVVCQTAPGLVGGITAMNSEGVAGGVDMAPSMLCDPERAGFNSLLLLRDSVHYGSCLQEAVAQIARAPRGVSWLYALASRNEQGGPSSCVVEAGKRLEGGAFPYLDHVSTPYKHLLEGIEGAIAQTPEYCPKNGLAVRRADYPSAHPRAFFETYNESLSAAFHKDGRAKLYRLLKDTFTDLKAMPHGQRVEPLEERLLRQLLTDYERIKYKPAAYGEDGFIDPLPSSMHCPGPFYFAPQREEQGELVLAGNQFLNPAMRLTAMNDWVALLAAKELNDTQWRYDALNHLLQQQLQQQGAIDEDSAWRLINFLSPDPEHRSPYSWYYLRGASGSEALSEAERERWSERQVHGSVSLCELESRRIKSLFGYYVDEPVTLTLPNYLKD
jgi:hypothetical protein